MTPSELKAHQFLISFWTTHGYGPSFEEIRTEMGWASKNGVHRIISALARKGYVKLGGTRNIIPVGLGGECPFCGREKAA